ncbi:restriction endonuclease subunit S [Providencia rettgeri]|uniref:restriction endonuclease subunit S n=1 Tax=Providencia rettgeri TaxID=587 RepID=UPI001F035881|nr:restriction endonuclease subunit S [Providencia rettgeri]EMC8778978.1 restriction endonuclease subunit S [Providencia rettgeri]MCG9942245.1 restriction endonuclease subunit S [Providencia rettgeri]
MTVEKLITDHIDIWSSALQTRSTAGRGSNGKIDLYGIKKLRELILELAVRGKLVPQDPNDEPASELLKRIAAEKAELVKQGKIKKQKPLPEISEDEKPFELPEGWEWVRLGNITIFTNGFAFKSNDFKNNGVGIVKIGDIDSSGFICTENMSYVDESVVKNLPSELQVEPGCLVIAMSGATTGKLGFNTTNKIYFLNQRVGKISPILINKYYLYYYLSTKVSENLSISLGSAIPNLSTAQISNILIYLPPKAEQERLVYKVNELMSLCDQLEQQSLTSLDAHQQLVETLLATLTDSQNAGELAENWARISQHFDTLFTTEASIDALKQTILQLAVMGKLVLQDPNDEPASELLKRIEQEKVQLVKECKIKKQKPLPPISDEEKPFELPLGWEWCRLGDLAHNSEAGWSPQCEASPRVDDNWGVLKISSVTWSEFNPNENKALPKHLEPKIEYEVKARDFLISRANTADLVARSVVVPDSPPKHLMLSDKIIRFQFSKLVDANYINLVNNSKYSRTYYSEVAGGTSSSMKNVSRIQVSSLLVALPSYSEQLNIVEKVRDLTLLCEHLKSRLQSAQQTQLHLADALTEAALN